MIYFIHEYESHFKPSFFSKNSSNRHGWSYPSLNPLCISASLVAKMGEVRNPWSLTFWKPKNFLPCSLLKCYTSFMYFSKLLSVLQRQRLCNIITIVYSLSSVTYYRSWVFCVKQIYPETNKHEQKGDIGFSFLLLNSWYLNVADDSWVAKPTKLVTIVNSVYYISSLFLKLSKSQIIPTSDGSQFYSLHCAKKERSQANRTKSCRERTSNIN